MADTVADVTQYAGQKYTPGVGRNAFSVAPKQFSISFTSEGDGLNVVLGPEDLRMRQITFVPKAGNSNSVFIQVKDSSGNWVNAAGGEITPDSKGVEWDAPANGHYSGQDFRVSGSDGEGVDVLYS